MWYHTSSTADQCYHSTERRSTMMFRHWFSLTLVLILRSATTGAFVLPGDKIAIATKHHHHQLPCRDVGNGGGGPRRCPRRGRSMTPATTKTKATTTELHVSGVDAVVIDSVRNLSVAGRIPWKKLLISKDQGRQIIAIMREETHVCDLVAVFILSVFLKKIGKFMYEKLLYRLRKKEVAYAESITYQIAETVSEAARLAAVCYFLDTVEVALEVTGIKGKKVDFSSLLAKLIFATWAGLRSRMYKRRFFEKIADYTPNQLNGRRGILEICDKISDFFGFGILALIWTDILKIKGHGLSSIFALGGFGTFTLTLACQDVAKRALNGLALSASDTFEVGDEILLGDGTCGTVLSVGWLNTEILGDDEQVTKIPNSDLSDVRISNRSRMKFSSVKQQLYFKYEDIERVPTLVDEIRNEIAASCPEVITDGSREFLVKWVDFGKVNVEVLVDCRLRTPPIGEVYYNARQKVLEAIARAVKRRDVTFAKASK